MKPIHELIEISRFYGRQKNFTLAGGGNTSYKNDKYIWVKASGISLADIDEEGFALLDRSKVKLTETKKYSNDPQVREKQVKEDLIASNAEPGSKKRPSVESSLHNLINYAFVIHMHPTITNALTCSNNAAAITRELFGEEVMFVRYAAGYDLFKIIQTDIEAYRQRFSKDPSIIFLQNHGVFVSADSISEIKALYAYITEAIKSRLHSEIIEETLPIREEVKYILPALRMILSADNLKVLKIRHNKLISHFYNDEESFRKASLPFTGIIIVYCKGKYMYISDVSKPEFIIREFKEQLTDFVFDNGYPPQIIMIKDYGVVAVGDNSVSAETTLDVYEDLLRISYYSDSFGGPHFLRKEDIAFIDNWKVENYQRQI